MLNSKLFRGCLLRGKRLYCSAGQTLKSGVKVDEGSEYKWQRMALWNVQTRAADSLHGWAHRTSTGSPKISLRLPHRLFFWTHQSAHHSTQGVGGVEELWAALGILRNFLLVAEPLVLGLWKAFLLHAMQLCGFAYRDGLWYGASGHDGLDCIAHKRSSQRSILTHIHLSDTNCKHPGQLNMLLFPLLDAWLNSDAVSEVSSYSPEHAL